MSENFQARNGKCPIYGKVIIRHGKEIEITPSSECPILEDFIDKTTSDIMKEPHIYESDTPTVAQLARIMGFLAIANKYLGEIGAFKIEGQDVNVQALVGTMAKYEQMVTKLLIELGLTPRSRIQLGLDKKHRKTFADMIIESGEDNAAK